MSVGAQLEQARNAKQLTIVQAADETKIQPWILESLEKDRFHDIVSPMYMRGFLKIYAKLLDLSYDDLLAQLPKDESDMLTDDIEPQPEEPMETVNIPWSAIARISSGVAVGFLVVFSISSLQPQKWFEGFKPASIATQLASMNPLQSSAATAEQEPLSLDPEKPLTLKLVAKKTTRVQLWADGRLLVQQQLKKGMEEQWVAKEGFRLVIAKPSEVELSLNGTSILPMALSHNGRLNISHEGVGALPDAV